MIASGLVLTALLAAFSPNGKDAAHGGLLTTPCVECHVRLPFSGGAPLLRAEVSQVCDTCHKRHHGADKMRSHPVDPVPSIRVPRDMLLDSKGRITCITCHAFHGEYRDEDGKKRFYLRRTPGKAFCFSCHEKIQGGNP